MRRSGDALGDAELDEVLLATTNPLLRVGARTLYCTHHEPTRGDDELEAAFADVMARHAPLPPGLRVVLAYEGLEVELS